MNQIHHVDAPCVAVVLPDSLLRLGLTTALARLGVAIHQNSVFDHLECTPMLLVVEPTHLTQCRAIYPDTPTLTVSLFESAVAATPATSPNEVVARVRKLLAPMSSPHQLSGREHQVLTLVSQGYSNDDIALECFISVESVKTHLTRVYRKLGVKNRAAAVAVGARQGILVL